MRTHNNPGWYSLHNYVGFEKLVKEIIETIIYPGYPDVTSRGCINYFEKQGQYPNKCFTIRITVPEEYCLTLKKINHLALEDSLRERKRVSEIFEDVLREKGKISNPPQHILIIPSPHNEAFGKGLRQLLKEDEPFEVFCINFTSSKACLYRLSNALVDEK